MQENFSEGLENNQEETKYFFGDESNEKEEKEKENYKRKREEKDENEEKQSDIIFFLQGNGLENKKKIESVSFSSKLGESDDEEEEINSNQNLEKEIPKFNQNTDEKPQNENETIITNNFNNSAFDSFVLPFNNANQNFQQMNSNEKEKIIINISETNNYKHCITPKKVEKENQEETKKEPVVAKILDGDEKDYEFRENRGNIQKTINALQKKKKKKFLLFLPQ